MSTVTYYLATAIATTLLCLKSVGKMLATILRGIMTCDANIFLSLHAIGVVFLIQVALIIAAIGLHDAGYKTQVWGSVAGSIPILCAFLLLMIYARHVHLQRVAQDERVRNAEMELARLDRLNIIRRGDGFRDIYVLEPPPPAYVQAPPYSPGPIAGHHAHDGARTHATAAPHTDTPGQPAPTVHAQGHAATAAPTPSRIPRPTI